LKKENKSKFESNVKNGTRRKLTQQLPGRSESYMQDSFDLTDEFHTS